MHAEVATRGWLLSCNHWKTSNSLPRKVPTDWAVVAGEDPFVVLLWQLSAISCHYAGTNFCQPGQRQGRQPGQRAGARKTVGSMRGRIMNPVPVRVWFCTVHLSFVPDRLWRGHCRPHFSRVIGQGIRRFRSRTGGCIHWHSRLVWSSAYWRVFTWLLIRPYSNLLMVVKGEVSWVAGNASTRGALRCFQFTTSIGLIIATLVIYQQVNYMIK